MGTKLRGLIAALLVISSLVVFGCGSKENAYEARNQPNENKGNKVQLVSSVVKENIKVEYLDMAEAQEKDRVTGEMMKGFIMRLMITDLKNKKFNPKYSIVMPFQVEDNLGNIYVGSNSVVLDTDEYNRKLSSNSMIIRSYFPKQLDKKAERLNVQCSSSDISEKIKASEFEIDPTQGKQQLTPKLSFEGMNYSKKKRILVLYVEYKRDGKSPMISTEAHITIDKKNYRSNTYEGSHLEDGTNTYIINNKYVFNNVNLTWEPFRLIIKWDSLGRPGPKFELQNIPIGK